MRATPDPPGIRHAGCSEARSLVSASDPLRTLGLGFVESHLGQPAIMPRMRVASASIANGFVIISIPGSRNPLAIVAFSA